MDRGSFWTVELDRSAPFWTGPFDTICRLTQEEGRDCDVYSVFPRGSELPLLQLRLFEDGATRVQTYTPADVRVDPAKKHAVVSLWKPDAEILAAARAMPADEIISPRELAQIGPLPLL